MRIFKKYKNRRSIGVPPQSRLHPVAGGSSPRPRVVTPAYYCNVIVFDSSAKCILLVVTIEKPQNNYSKYFAFTFCSLLHLFFLLQTLQF